MQKSSRWLCPNCLRWCKAEAPRVCRECHFNFDAWQVIDEWTCKECGNQFQISGCRLCFKCGWCEDCRFVDEEWIGYGESLG